MNCSDSNREGELQMLSELREVITGTTSLVVYGFGVVAGGPGVPLRKEASVEDGP